MSKFQVGDRVTDGFSKGTVVEIDNRPHGLPDYWVKMDDEERISVHEENFIEKLTGE